jgi:ADP-ribose pyrophosphatase YjhB (NUDIX family)
MNAVDEMFKKTSHSAKVVAMCLDPEGGLPWIALVHTKKREGAPRKPDRNGKSQKPYIRREGWAVAGGTVEASDYENVPDNGAELKNYVFRNAAKRELHREAGIIVPFGAFSEKWSIHVPPVVSDRIGSDYLETHYYLIILETMVQHVPIIETDEVIEMGWFRLDEIPLPDSRKERVASFQKHIQNIEKNLQLLQTRFENADIWLKTFRKRFGPYLY